jgi:hypothetical protein
MAIEFNEDEIKRIAQALPNVGHDVLIRAIMYCNQVGAIPDDIVKLLFNKFIVLANEQLEKQSATVLKHKLDLMK